MEIKNEQYLRRSDPLDADSTDPENINIKKGIKLNYNYFIRTRRLNASLIF